MTDLNFRYVYCCFVSPFSLSGKEMWCICIVLYHASIITSLLCHPFMCEPFAHALFSVVPHVLYVDISCRQ